ncbi:MAG TPA: NrfD/PsrC family molybdoenzyme membrane anchor subunit, partial [Terriglobales bacterium]|nr:NrfD/PsrC family molybdoenzyme membrane anchor subunit [Terriglobales bacterium]
MKHIEWGYLIVSYLFLGGVSAGIYFVSALATMLQKNGDDAAYEHIAKLGALLAPWPVMVGSFLLIFDLGRWYRFWKLFMHVKWTSPMSLGSWLLIAFCAVSVLYFYSWLSEQQRAWIFSRVPKRLSFLNRDISGKHRVLALAGLPISVGVGIYTGVLLGAVQSRPFWNTNLVAQLFLFSALSTGCAVIMLALAYRHEPSDSRGFQLVYNLDVGLITLEFFIVIPYIVHGQLSVQAVKNSLALIVGGPFTFLFWVFFLGLGLV